MYNSKSIDKIKNLCRELQWKKSKTFNAKNREFCIKYPSLNVAACL